MAPRPVLGAPEKAVWLSVLTTKRLSPDKGLFDQGEVRKKLGVRLRQGPTDLRPGSRGAFLDGRAAYLGAEAPAGRPKKTAFLRDQIHCRRALHRRHKTGRLWPCPRRTLHRSGSSLSLPIDRFLRE